MTRVPGGQWRLIAGPFETVREAHDVARSVLRDTPRGEAIVGYCPWVAGLDERGNVDNARESGAIERVS